MSEDDKVESTPTKFTYYDDNDNEVERDLTPMELEFLAVQNQAREEIDAYIKQARDALSNAVKASEKYGIPFYSNVSFLGNMYTPNSFNKKYKKLDGNFLNEVAGVYPNEYGYWEHSQVC